MNDEITLDFLKLQNIVNTLKDCTKNIKGLDKSLDDGISNMGLWWKGLTYDAYSEEYGGKGRKKWVLTILIEKNDYLIGYLNKQIESRKSFERSTSKLYQ
ncbi:MAG: hypothetical protein FWH52_03220 [Synergistaceae bacterium]|nr:hypothetical protein [Synergistaceae bacterium]